MAPPPGALEHQLNGAYRQRVSSPQLWIFSTHAMRRSWPFSCVSMQKVSHEVPLASGAPSGHPSDRRWLQNAPHGCWKTEARAGASTGLPAPAEQAMLVSDPASASSLMSAIGASLIAAPAPSSR